MEKLFYSDPMCQSFTATVLSCRKRDKGFAVELDRTAFFPGGGGQPTDRGTLGSTQVITMEEQGERIFHVCSGPLEEGSQVTGCIDFEARFDAMQQHSGEHILAGLLHKTFGYHNVGFHLGAQISEIDFDGPIEAHQLRQIEQQANAIVCRDLPLRCWTPDPQELEKQVYRSKKALPWPVRLVEIPQVDSCACCGVHVVRTGQIGLIKILSCTKFHQGVRLEVVCGGRAWAMADLVFGQNRAVAQLVSTPITDTAQGVEKVCHQLAQERSRCAQLEKELFASVAAARPQGDGVLVRENLTGGSQRALCQQLRECCGGVQVVLTPEQDAVALCVLGQPERVQALGTHLKSSLPSRFGGKPGSLQGRVQAPLSQVKEAVDTFFRGE